MKLIIATVHSYRMEKIIEKLDKIQDFRKTVSKVPDIGQPQTQKEEADGKIFILPMEDCIQISTGKRGSEAVVQ